MVAAHDLLTALGRNVDEIVRAVVGGHPDAGAGPAIAKITYVVDRDWSGDDAIHFMVILRDPPGGIEYPIAAVLAIRDDLHRRVRDAGIAHIPYVNFRLESEQRELDADPDARDD